MEDTLNIPSQYRPISRSLMGAGLGYLANNNFKDSLAGAGLGLLSSIPRYALDKQDKQDYSKKLLGNSLGDILAGIGIGMYSGNKLLGGTFGYALNDLDASKE